MTSGAPLVVVGDALLDRDLEGSVDRLCPDAPVPVLDETAVRSRPGGAGLAAVLAAGSGREVTLITALARDAPGAELRATLEATGVDVVDLGLDGATPEKIRLRTGARSLLRLDRGGEAGRVGSASAAARAAIGWAGAVLVADYGRGVAREPGLHEALEGVDSGVPVVWDPHPRGCPPVHGVTLATPNLDEARRYAPEMPGADDVAGAARRAQELAHRWGALHVVVTCGARGAVLAGADGQTRAFPAPPVAAGDVCGAGDRFASRAAEALADGAGPGEAVAAAVHAASAFVATGGAAAVSARAASPRAPAAHATEGDAAIPHPADDALAAADRVRAAGGTVVATGGCFDLLHTGHVRTLHAARALGDCLLVCINSDASVRRLKGPGRPVVGERDRADVLRALRCVDAVAVFGEDTPAQILERLRPDVWAKGGDYHGARLPEAGVLDSWAGQTVLLPYLDGHSTTRLIEGATLRAVT